MKNWKVSTIFKKSMQKYFIIIFYFIVSPFSVSADGLGDFSGKTKKLADNAGFDTQDSTTLLFSIGVFIQVALSLLGVIFLLLTIYAGYLWMTDRGNEQQVEKAKKMLTAAVIGLVIVLGAYAISYFVIDALQSQTLK